jgi:hypothetical protein
VLLSFVALIEQLPLLQEGQSRTLSFSKQCTTGASWQARCKARPFDCRMQRHGLITEQTGRGSPFCYRIGKASYVDRHQLAAPAAQNTQPPYCLDREKRASGRMSVCRLPSISTSVKLSMAADSSPKRMCIPCRRPPPPGQQPCRADPGRFIDCLININIMQSTAHQ